MRLFSCEFPEQNDRKQEIPRQPRRLSGESGLFSLRYRSTKAAPSYCLAVFPNRMIPAEYDAAPRSRHAAREARTNGRSRYLTVRENKKREGNLWAGIKHRSTVPVLYAAGSTIFEIGQPRDAMFIVQEGEVEIKVGNKVVEWGCPPGRIGRPSGDRYGKWCHNPALRVYVRGSKYQFQFASDEHWTLALASWRTQALQSGKTVVLGLSSFWFSASVSFENSCA
jgi:hypothetical protein